MALRLVDVGVRRNGRWILRGVSLEVPAGSTCAVVGPNGSGKSTLLRVIEGYVFPTVGEVYILGKKLGETPLAELRKRVRLVGTAEGEGGAEGKEGGEGASTGGRLDFSSHMTLREVVASGGRGRLVMYEPPDRAETRSANRLLREVGLEVGLRWGVASAGERMRALLARARMPVVGGARSGQPGEGDKLVLLDEPTANLDLAAREHSVVAIGCPPKEVTQLIVTHHLEELPESTERALLLAGGRVVAAGAAMHVLTTKNLTRAFGVPVRVSRRRGRDGAGWRWSAGVV